MVELPEISEREEESFPYWFSVSDLEPEYGDSTIWFTCRDGKARKTLDLEELTQIVHNHEGIIEIIELDDYDPIPGSDDEGYSGIYFHLLHARFKSVQKLSETFRALSEFLTINSYCFEAGKYPKHFDDEAQSQSFSALNEKPEILDKIQRFFDEN